MPSPFAHRLIAAAAFALALTGCVPATSAYLRVPVETSDGRPRREARILVPLGELRARMPDLDPEALAFYGRGRAPLPHRLVDLDGDGLPDAALVVLSVAGDGSTQLIAVCPGPGAHGEAAAGDPAEGIVLRFDRARS